MSTVSASPTQATAMRAWVIACLNLGDDGIALSPAPFSTSNVRWSHSDYPRAGDRYAMLREVSFVELGPPEEQRQSIDVDLPGERLVVSQRSIAEWTVSVQVVARLSDSDPVLADNAARLLRRVTMRVLSELTGPMRAIGCAWRRSGQILPLPRIARGSQWETRAAVDLTFCVGEYIVDEPGWIDSVAGTGTLSPLPSEPFTADHEDDLDDLL